MPRLHGHRRHGRRWWPLLAAQLLLVLSATGTVAVVPPAVAQVSAPTVTVGTVVGASGPVHVPVTVAGFGNAPGLLAVLSLPADGGSLQVDPTGLGVEPVLGSTWPGARSLSFTGSVADVTTALQSRLSWAPPQQGARAELRVVVREHVPGTFYDPVSGHDYEIVDTKITWAAAKAAAAGKRLLGRAGYLATVTSQRENDLVAPYVAEAVKPAGEQTVWLGASDDLAEVNAAARTSNADRVLEDGQWHWVTGPETGTPFWSGGADGAVLPEQFANWWEGEPNDFHDGEHYAGLYADGGTWNDWGSGWQDRYLVEYGGLTGDVSTARSATTTRTLTDAQTAARDVLSSHSSGGPAPTTADYANAGVVGVDAGRLAAVNSVLAERRAVEVPAGVQAVVDAYAKVLGTAADPGYSPALTVEDLAALGLIVAPGDLGRVVASVAQTADDGSQVQPLPVLRLLVSRATARAEAATAPVVVAFTPGAGTTRAEVSAELPGGRLVLSLDGVTRPGVLDVRTTTTTGRSTEHLDVGSAVVLDVGSLEVTSVRVCLPVDAATLPAGLSVAEVRVLQVVDGRRVDVTSRTERDEQAVCGTSRTVGEFVLGVDTVTRRSGPDRYATAAAASSARFAPGVPVVYVASGDGYADALAGGAGAAALGGPLLLVGRSGPSAAVIDELERLRPTRIALLGGPGALSAGLERSLDPFTDGQVTRLAGADRYSTAAAASRDAFPSGASTAYLASGHGYADAIAGGAAAAADGAPLLLTAGSSVPESTLAELARLGVERVVLLGGTDVLSGELLAQLHGRGLDVERRAGGDRYGTAAAAALSAFPRGAEVVYLVSGATFADVLSSVPVSAHSRAPVLLLAADAVPSTTATALRRLAPRRVVVLGGSSAVAPDVLAQVQRLMAR